MSENTENPEEQNSPLILKKRENKVTHLGPTKPCPSCKGDAPEAAVICTLCGYNFETKKKLRTSTGKLKKILIPAFSLVAIIAVAAIAVNLAKNATGKAKEAIDHSVSAIKEKADELSTEITEAAQPYLDDAKEIAAEAKGVIGEVSGDIKSDLKKEGYLNSEDAAEKNKDEEDASETFDNADSEEDIPEDDTGVVTEDSEALSAEDSNGDPVFNKLKAQLDQRYPMINKREFAKIKLANGKEISGILVYTVVDYFMFENAKGDRVKVPYDKLHKSSRIRLDRAFRKQYITDAADKKRAAS